MLTQFNQFIVDKLLFQPDDRLLVAVSGGVDSVVLCHLLFCFHQKFAIAHCNFGLRAADSDADEAFVKKLGLKYQVPCYSKKMKPQQYCETHQCSIQMAARALRYEWFQELILENNFQYLATAHHLNDSLETALLNLTKGTGIAGVRGILPKTNNIVRPLLFASKETIVQYAESQNLTWREDVSNATTKYQRNLLRHEVVPVLKQINPNLETTFAHTLERLQATEQIFQKYIAQIRQQYLKMEDDVTVIDTTNIAYESHYSMLLFELLKEFSFTWADAEAIAESNNDGVKHFFATNYKLLKYQNQLRIYAVTEVENFTEQLIALGDTVCRYGNYSIELSYPEPKQIDFTSHTNEAFFDIDLLQFPLMIRPWHPGDRFQPSGMKGLKKISDYLIDEKIPLDKKEKVWVLLSGETIVWVVGMRAAHVARIGNTTTRVMKFKLISND